MNTDPKKEEAPLQPTSPLHENNDTSDLTLPAKRVKVTMEGLKQTEIDKLVKYLIGMKKRAQKDILHVGGELFRMRHKIPHGHWGRFIEVNFTAVTGLSIKTANIWIRAYENRDSELAVNDWGAYMRALYGNEPKKIKGASYKYQPDDEDDEDRDDLEQSGGEGPAFGREEKGSIFTDKGKPSFTHFHQLVTRLEREFFQSKEISRQAKLNFIDDLINWLENQKKNIRA